MLDALEHSTANRREAVERIVQWSSDQQKTTEAIPFAVHALYLPV
jgi:hypothetical protein